MTTVFPLRRVVLKMLGGAALAGLVRAQSSPSLTEGPYFVDEELNRSDIRVDSADGSVQPGYPLSLSLQVAQLKNGVEAPLTGAYVDIWHCNALGVYSDIAQQGSTGKKYLRGYQATNRQGRAYFLTVYPGWYMGRAVHIHVKVRYLTARRRLTNLPVNFSLMTRFRMKFFGSVRITRMGCGIR